MPFPSQGGLPNPGVECMSPALQADFYHCATWEEQFYPCSPFKENVWDTQSLTLPLIFDNTQSPKLGFPGGSAVKNLPANAGDTGDMVWIPGSGRSPGGGHGNPLQYSGLENRVDRRAWLATVNGIEKGQTRQSN